MGAGESKPDSKNVSSDFKGADLLDMIATKYILTQNFQDMRKLSQKEYCDKLVILTADIIKKFMKDKNIRYLAQRVDNGIPYNRMTKEKLMYLDTGEIDISGRSKGYSQRDVENIKRLYDEANHGRSYSGGAMRDYLDVMQWFDEYKDKKKQPPSTKSITRRKRTVLSRLDVKDPIQKERMCKGIARFYISIAHLYAAIVKTVNPVYTFKDSKGIHTYSMMNKSKIPKGARAKLAEINLCTRRIKAVKPKTDTGNVTINMSSVCRINKKKHTVTMEDEQMRPSQWGETQRDTRDLTQEPGIPELIQLYYDNYDYTKGKFVGMVKGGNAEKQYRKDLEEFYTAFTGGQVPYKEWNKGNNKRFSDIRLEDYHDKSVCKDPTSIYNKSYTGSGGLFADYANHITSMIKQAQTNQANLMSILDKVFKIQVLKDQNRTEVVTLNPGLNDGKLMELIAEARQAIVKLYIACEKDFKKALDIFEGITLLREVKTTINREKTVTAQLDTVSTGSQKDVDKDVMAAIMKFLKEQK